MKSSLADNRNMLGVMIAVAAVVIGYVWYTNRPSPADHVTPAAADAPVLKKVWEHFGHEDDNIVVTGQVTNISHDRVAYFQAMTIFLDAAGSVVKTSPVSIDHVSLDPGETAKYKTISAPSDRIEIEVTNFTDVSGIPIPTEKAPNAPQNPFKNTVAK